MPQPLESSFQLERGGVLPPDPAAIDQGAELLEGALDDRRQETLLVLRISLV